MLSDLIKQGFGEKEDLNCAEKILYGANLAYDLGLNQETLRLAAGFGGGMCLGSVCGTLTAAIMVLGTLFVEHTAHKSKNIKRLTQELLSSFRKEMGEINCSMLKVQYRKGPEKCLQVLAKTAELLDRIVERELPEIWQSRLSKA
jgi:C_GCAxxG_C_C family probable redox protein